MARGQSVAAWARKNGVAERTAQRSPAGATEISRGMTRSCNKRFNSKSVSEPKRRIGREATMDQLIRVGRRETRPAFLVWKCDIDA